MHVNDLFENDGASADDIASSIFWRLGYLHPDLANKYSQEDIDNTVYSVASFHEGARELGSSDISAMVNQVLRRLESGNVNEGQHEIVYHKTSEVDIDPNKFYIIPFHGGVSDPYDSEEAATAAMVQAYGSDDPDETGCFVSSGAEFLDSAELDEGTDDCWSKGYQAGLSHYKDLQSSHNPYQQGTQEYNDFASGFEEGVRDSRDHWSESVEEETGSPKHLVHIAARHPDETKHTLKPVQVHADSKEEAIKKAKAHFVSIGHSIHRDDTVHKYKGIIQPSQGVVEGRFVKGPGGVPLDRQGVKETLDTIEGMSTAPKIALVQQTPGSWARINILVNGAVMFQAVKTMGPGHWTIHNQDGKTIGGGGNKSELKASVLDYLSKQGVKEGRFVKGPGGVPLDRQGNPKVAKPAARKPLPVPKLQPPHPEMIWRKVEEVVGRIFPDGDPIDYLVPWFNKQGIYDWKIGELLRDAAKKHGYEDVYDYWESLKRDLGDDYGLNEAAEPTQIDLSAVEVHRFAKSIMVELVDEFAGHQADSSTSPAAPDSSKFRAHHGGMIEYEPNVEIYSSYIGTSTRYMDFVKLGSNVPLDIRSKIQSEFVEEMASVLNVSSMPQSFYTNDGYMVSFGTVSGSNWGGFGIRLTKAAQRPSLTENSAEWYDLSAEHVPYKAIPQIKRDLAQAGIQVKSVQPHPHESNAYVFSIVTDASGLKAAKDVIWQYNNGLSVNVSEDAGAGEVDTDQILYYLTAAYRVLENNREMYMSFENIELVYSMLRDELKKGDYERFSKTYSYLLGKYPDAMTELMNEAFAKAGLDERTATIEDFLDKCSNDEQLDEISIPKVKNYVKGAMQQTISGQKDRNPGMKRAFSRMAGTNKPILDPKKHVGEDKSIPDSELQSTLDYAHGHYPSLDKDTAFKKFVQRSLKHSKETDAEQDAEIARLGAMLKSALAKK